MNNSFRFVDVSHTIEHGLVTYKGLPSPVISDFLSREDSRAHYAQGTEFNIARIEMVANTGTYLDSPFHRFPDGKDLADLELSSLANLEGIVFRTDSIKQEIDVELFGGAELKGKAVLINTGWSKHWRTDEYWSGNHPFLSEAAAQLLADSGATLVGIDSYNIDDTRRGTRPAHTILLKANIPIVEHLCRLNELPEAGFKFFAVPVKVRQFGTFPVRAFGLVSASDKL